MAKLTAVNVGLQEENDRMKREIARGGGDLWSSDDSARDIARVLGDSLTTNKLKDLIREIRKLLKAGETNA